MHIRRRRLFAVLSAMLFSLSILGHGFMQGDLGAKIAMSASAAMPAQDGAMDCDKSAACDDMQDMILACVVHCASIVAVLSDPAPMSVVAIARDVPSGAASKPVSRNGPPDPHPPKPVV